MVLPATARLTRREDFQLVTRRGRRAGTRHVVVHVVRGGDAGPPRVGFVVSKAVGNSVVRHRVTRRLRHVMADRLAALPAGVLIVVRALPPAATASSVALGVDLNTALLRAGITATTGDRT